MNTTGESYHQNQDTAHSGWDSLKNEPFAGDTIQPKAHYNKRYINNFGRDKLRGMLKDEKVLKSTSEAYLGQYDPKARTIASDLVAKTALDNFVVERLSSENPEMFLESQEFKNYANYITSLGDQKKFELKDGEICLYPEYFTNPVFKNKSMREAVFRAAYPTTDINKLNAWFEQHKTEYEDTVKDFVENGLEKRRQLTQKQMDIVGDYIYAGENYGDEVAEKYAEYCFNEIKDGSSIKPSVPMLGALTNYFAKSYTIDEDVREDSRIIIASHPDGDPDRAFHVGASTQDGCIMQKGHFLEMSLTSDESLNKSRTNRDNDLYRLMMITFHELTHDHQKNSVKRGDTSSSAMSHILNRVLNRGGMKCYAEKDDAGNITQETYYRVNHDNDEIEIQADEEAWRQCRAFLVEHQKAYAWKHGDKKLESDFEARWGKCQDNEREVRARRVFTRKLAETGEEVSPTQYDIANLEAYVQKWPNLLNRFPQLNNFVGADGSLKPDILFNSKIAEVNYDGLDERTDTFGVEFGSYLLANDNGASQVVAYIRKNGANLSDDQVKNLLSNLYRVVHQNVLKSRSLSNINFANYDETHASGKAQTPQELKDGLLKNYMHECYNAIYIAEMIRKIHPELTAKISEKESSISSYFPELFKEGQLEQGFAEAAVRIYEKTKHPILLKIASTLKNNYNA